MLHYGTLRYFTVHCFISYYFRPHYINLHDTRHTTRPRPRTWMINRVHMTKHVYFCCSMCMCLRNVMLPFFCPVKIKLGRVVNYRICIHIYIYTYIYIIIYLFLFLNRGNLPCKSNQPVGTGHLRETFPNGEPPVFVSEQPLDTSLDNLIFIRVLMLLDIPYFIG